MKTDVMFTHRDIAVRRTTLQIPTYQLGPPDPNPPLFGKGLWAIYPYPWRKSFTTEIVTRSYDAVILTSPWIEATILPDWGFHLYRAVDRRSGRDLFHVPRVMKPAFNAARGAYVAGGVEYNFHLGHNAMTWERVGVALRRTAEGVTALSHDVDRRSGVVTVCGITLRPDYRGLLFDVYVHNPTPLPQPWQCWINAGIAPHPSLRFVFPTDHMLGHFEGPFLETKTRYPYPQRAGHDYSSSLDIPEPIGLFSPKDLEGFFGAWYADWKFGLARWAPPWKAAGQKLWSWGNSEEGLLWGEIGADQAVPLPEIQSGLQVTQCDRSILAPYETVTHREWWFPVTDTSGLSTASQWGALHVAPHPQGTRVEICPVQAVAAARLRVNGRETEHHLELAPDRGWQGVLDAPFDAIRELVVADEEGSLLTWSAANPPPPANSDGLYDRLTPVAEMGAEALTIKGFRYERLNRPDWARRYYALALARDPLFSLAHLRLGVLALQRNDPVTAQRELQTALDSNQWSEEALYLHGLAALWQGAAEQARVDFRRVTALGRQYRIPAIVQLILDAWRRQELNLARQLLADGLAMEPAQATLLFLKTLDARLRQDQAAVGRTCAELEQQAGVSLLADHERAFAGLPQETIYIPAKPEAEDAHLIWTALRYVECGRLQEAEQLLRAARSPSGRAEAGYLLTWLGAEGKALRESARVGFFAWGREIQAALTAALRAAPDDPAARFSLGCLLAEHGYLEPATEHLRAADVLQPDDAIIATALGTVYLEQGRGAAAVEILRRAIGGAPNPKAWIQLDKALALVGQRDAAWREQFAGAPAVVLDNEEARQRLAALCADQGHYDQAADLLRNRVFHPYELTHDLRNLWVRIHRDQALFFAEHGNLAAALEAIAIALQYPPHLGLGKPLRRFDAGTLYVAGRIAELAGQPERARAYFEEAAAENPPDPTWAKPWSALAEIHLGRAAAGQARLAAFVHEAQTVLAAECNLDLADVLRRSVELAAQMQNGWVPTLAELSRRRTP